MFDILGNGEKAGYFDDLADYVEILGTFFNDVDEYVKRAQDNKKTAKPTASSKSSGDKTPTELDEIKNALDRLHGRIGMLYMCEFCIRSSSFPAVDTSIIDLARTKVKAGLQHLSARIHYTAIAKRGKSANKGLQSWLKPNPVKKNT